MLFTFPEIEDQGLNVQDETNQVLSGSKQNNQYLGGLDLHDPDTIAGKLMQIAEPIVSAASQLHVLL